MKPLLCTRSFLSFVQRFAEGNEGGRARPVAGGRGEGGRRRGGARAARWRWLRREFARHPSLQSSFLLQAEYKMVNGRLVKRYVPFGEGSVPPA